ncbi:MAG: DUF4118 domain-containing protein [Parasporobacterium sp.]|nr:DUF4118 domain-containing protein [Parasporobacterium sp.]
MSRLFLRIKKHICFSVRDTLITAGIFAAAFALCFVLQHFSENDFHVPLIFVLVVMIVSRMTDGYLYGLVAAAAGVISVNYVFTYPYFELDFTMTGYPLTFTTMLLVSLVTSTMTTRIKNQERYIKEGEKEKLRSELFRGISHDIRTPLTGIVGATTVLLENENISGEVRRELLQDINDDSQWLIHMIENVLSITRMGDSSETIRKEPEIVEEIIGEAIRKFRKQWPEIPVRVRIPDEMLFVPMDAILIGQVIQNILHNSMIHGEGCTRIEVEVFIEDQEAVFRFRDNGCGFTWDRSASRPGQPVLSDTTGRLDRQKNMGIGLSLCRTIIQAHKGRLELSNAPEGGAVVEFCLPLKEQNPG